MNDPINFCTAEEYFSQLPGWKGPKQITSISDVAPADIKVPACWHGVTLTFDDSTLCVVQFIRPTLWRVRYDTSVKELNGYSDLNRSVGF